MRTEAHHGPQDDLSILVGAAIRHGPLIASTALVLGGLGYLVSAQMEPTFRAETTLLLDARRPPLGLEEEKSSLPEDGTLRVWLTRSESAVLGSEPVARAAFSRLSLEEQRQLLDKPASLGEIGAADAAAAAPDRISWSQDGPLPSTSEGGSSLAGAAFEGYREAVAVRDVDNTFLLRVSADAPTAPLAAKIANAHAQAYLAADVDRKRRQIKSTRLWLDSEITRQHEALARLEAEIDRYKRSSGIVRIHETDLTASRLAQLDAALSEARAKLSVAEARLASATGAGVGAVVGADEPLIVQLRMQLTDVEREIRQTDHTARHPTVLALQQERKTLEWALASEVERYRDAMAKDVEVSQRNVEGLEAQVGDLESALLEANRLAVDLEQLEREADLLRERTQDLLRRRSLLEAQLQAVTADARIVEPASPPREPSAPRPKLVAALGVVVGAAGGMGFGLWSDRRSKAQSVASMAEGLGMRLLGALPRLPSEVSARADMLLGHGDGMETQRVRDTTDAARAMIDSGGVEHARVAVMSALSAEGKTTVAAALAASYVRAGYRTLLVDGDREPSGLDELLSPANADLPSSGMRTVFTDSGSFDTLAARLFLFGQRNSRMRDGAAALNEYLAQYERVVIDCPPLPLGDDALVLAHVCPAVVIAAASGRTTEDSLKTARDRLAAIDVDVLGVILSPFNPRADQAAMTALLGDVTGYYKRRPEFRAPRAPLLATLRSYTTGRGWWRQRMPWW